MEILYRAYLKLAVRPVSSVLDNYTDVKIDLKIVAPTILQRP